MNLFIKIGMVAFLILAIVIFNKSTFKPLVEGHSGGGGGRGGGGIGRGGFGGGGLGRGPGVRYSGYYGGNSGSDYTDTFYYPSYQNMIYDEYGNPIIVRQVVF